MWSGCVIMVFYFIILLTVWEITPDYVYKYYTIFYTRYT